MALGLPLLKMAKKSFLKTFKGLQMNKKEYKKYENVSIWEILGACTFGAILGAFIAFNF